jgi:GxxExxY protein
MFDEQHRARVNDLSYEVIGAAIEVHRTLGPGLLEAAYEACLCHELELRRMPFVRQLELPVNYKGVLVDCAFRIDLLVADILLLELKAVEKTRSHPRGPNHDVPSIAECVAWATDQLQFRSAARFHSPGRAGLMPASLK